jgi:hypothetical protein
MVDLASRLFLFVYVPANSLLSSQNSLIASHRMLQTFVSSYIDTQLALELPSSQLLWVHRAEATCSLRAACIAPPIRSYCRHIPFHKLSVIFKRASSHFTKGSRSRSRMTLIGVDLAISASDEEDSSS